MSRSGVAALDKGTTLACSLRLAAKHRESAKLTFITLKEYECVRPENQGGTT